MDLNFPLWLHSANRRVGAPVRKMINLSRFPRYCQTGPLITQLITMQDGAACLIVGFTKFWYIAESIQLCLGTTGGNMSEWP